MLPKKSLAIAIAVCFTISTGAMRVKQHRVSATKTTNEKSKTVPSFESYPEKLVDGWVESWIAIGGWVGKKVLTNDKLQANISSLLKPQKAAVRLMDITKLVAAAGLSTFALLKTPRLRTYANSTLALLRAMYHTRMGHALDPSLGYTMPEPKAFTELLKKGLAQSRPCAREAGCNYCTDVLCEDTGRLLMLLFSNYVKTFTSLKETLAEANTPQLALPVSTAEDAFWQHVSAKGLHGLHLPILTAEDFVQKETSSPRGARNIAGANLDANCRIARETFPQSLEPFGKGVGMIMIGPPDDTRGGFYGHPGFPYYDHIFNIEVSGDHCYILQSWADRFSLQDWLHEAEGDSRSVEPSTSWRCLDRNYKFYRKGGGEKVEECEAWRSSRARYGLGQPLKCDDLNANPRATFFDMHWKPDMAQVYLDLIRFYLISRKQQKTIGEVERFQFGIKAWPEPAAWKRLETLSPSYQ